MTDRVIRDGRVAVVYSPGFGAGWSTWDHGNYGDALVFDPNIVTYVETKRWNELKVYMELKYPDLYLGGIGDLTVEWVPVGAQFKVTEYDGSESIEYRDSEDWLIA